MLTFADSAWQIFANLGIFLIGLLISLGQRRVLRVPQKRAVLLYFWHSFFSCFYFWYSLNNIADSTRYYLTSLDYDLGFAFGTDGIYYLVSPMTQYLNLSYGGVFLVFNIIGYIGLVAFASALQSVTTQSQPGTKRLAILVLLLPGFSFWSGAIGKDALTFMGAGLATWAALDIKRRLPVLAASVLLFLIPRPHMAGILLASATLAILLSSKMGLYRRVALLTISIPLCIAAVQFSLDYVGLKEATNAQSISDYFEARQNANLGGGSSVDIESMSRPLRMFTYLFRPLFFDAGGLLGLVVSGENFILLFLIAGVSLRLRRTQSSLGDFEKFFLVIFVVVSWSILSNTTANLGIAIRQKIMFLPMLIVLMFSYLHKSPRPGTLRANSK